MHSVSFKKSKSNEEQDNQHSTKILVKRIKYCRFLGIFLHNGFVETPKFIIQALHSSCVNYDKSFITWQMENRVNQGKTRSLPQWVIISGELMDIHSRKNINKSLQSSFHGQLSTGTWLTPQRILILFCLSINNFETAIVPYCTTGTLWNFEYHFHQTCN